MTDADPQDTAEFVFPASLRSGDNLLAVMLIQANSTSSDLTMGLRIVALTQTTGPGGARLSFTYNGSNLTITWNPAGGTLQSSVDLKTWQDVTGAASPYTVTNVKTAGAHKFFRVVQ